MHIYAYIHALKILHIYIYIFISKLQLIKTKANNKQVI